MRPSHLSLLAAVRLYAPLIVLLALTMLVLRAPGGGVGFVGGIVFAIALVAHALVFGAAEARKALPPTIARALLASGLIPVVVGALGVGGALAPRIGEAGLFLVTVSALHLVFAVLFGRAPTLRDGDAS